MKKYILFILFLSIFSFVFAEETVLEDIPLGELSFTNEIDNIFYFSNISLFVPANEDYSLIYYTVMVDHGIKSYFTEKQKNILIDSIKKYKNWYKNAMSYGDVIKKEIATIPNVIHYSQHYNNWEKSDSNMEYKLSFYSQDKKNHYFVITTGYVSVLFNYQEANYFLSLISFDNDSIKSKKERLEKTYQ